MLYAAEDIRFEQLNPTEFERLCFELLLKLGFRQLIWRQGGADNGRDIEGIWTVETPLSREDCRWFFECKHYTAGVPPEQLNAKVAWADAEQPACLVILISSYLTNNARTWLEQIRAQKHYRIQVIEGQELKNFLLRFPALIEQHFAANRYEQLLLDARRHNSEYRIALSYDLLYALSQHLNPARLTLNDLGFLFTGLYSQYNYLADRNDYYGDFDPKVMKPFYERLRELAVTTSITLFDQYRDNYDYLGGSGFWDDMESWETGLEGESKAAYQYNTFHLNHRGPDSSWALGHYLFFRISTGEAFELFCVEDSDFTTAARYFAEVSPATVGELCLQGTAYFKALLEKKALIFQRPPEE
jgi:hypothetical protein